MCLQNTNTAKLICLEWHHLFLLADTTYANNNTEFMISAMDRNNPSWKKKGLLCMCAGCVGWSENSTQNPSCTMPRTTAWSSPVAPCQFHHYLDCFGYKASSLLPFVSSDPEQTNKTMTRWAKCPSSDSLCAALPPSSYTTSISWGTGRLYNQEAPKQQRAIYLKCDNVV